MTGDPLRAKSIIHTAQIVSIKTTIQVHTVRKVHNSHIDPHSPLSLPSANAFEQGGLLFRQGGCTAKLISYWSAIPSIALYLGAVCNTVFG